jgi:hypothetical protein
VMGSLSFWPCNSRERNKQQLTPGRAVDDHGTGWSDLWDNNESNLWDRGRPSPALIDLIEQRPDIFNSHAADECRKKALVPVRCTVINC